MEFAGSPFDIKTLDDSGAIEGLLAGFGDCDRLGDKLIPGCLTKSLAERRTPLPMLFCHDLRRPIGAWKSWAERGDGLFVKGRIVVETRDGAEAHKLAKEGALSALSIGWSPLRCAPGDDGERLVVEAELFEGSLVSVGAHPRTTVTALKGFDGPRDLAEFLQEKGMPGRSAREAAGVLWADFTEQSHRSAIDADLAAIDQAKAIDEAKVAAILKASTARINSIRRVGP